MYRLDAERVGKEAACELGDARLERRMERIVGTMCKRPSASLPAMFPDEADSEAVYRFLRNERLSLGRVLRGHVAHTVARAQSLGTVIVIHDTTEFSFAVGKERRRGLQRHSEVRQGFFGHVSLGVSADGARAPLGCLWMQPFVRLAQLDNEAERQDWQRLMGRDFSEPGRWLKGIRHSERLLGPKVSAIHVCDREGDSYPLLSKLVGDRSRFVVRLSQNRTLSCPNLCSACSASLEPSSCQSDWMPRSDRRARRVIRTARVGRRRLSFAAPRSHSVGPPRAEAMSGARRPSR